MPFSLKRRSRTFCLAMLILLVPVTAVLAQGVVGARRTVIASPPEGGTASDGPSDNVTFSGDTGIRLMAFDSIATNLVPGDANQKRDVILFIRGKGEGVLDGELRRISVGPKSKEANGDSSRPSIDGEGARAPHCVVFESTATNIDAPLTKKERRAKRRRKLDTTADSDVYLYDVNRKTTSLVSVGHKNAVHASIDGSCEFVAYEASGNIFVRDLEQLTTTKIARGQNPDQQGNGKGVAYERRGQIHYQAYIRKFRSAKKGGPYMRKEGKEVLVSAGKQGKGNGVSEDPSMDDNGYYVAFESTATNLCQGLCAGISEDRNGPISDVFRRTLNTKKAPSHDQMQMVSFSWGAKGEVGEQGNGPSNNPAMTAAGENILFDSEATNLRQSLSIRSIDPNGPIRDIYYWDFPRERLKGAVSRESKPEAKREFNGPSTNPGTSARANYIGFTSTQTGQSGEANGPSIADVFIRFLGGSDEGRVEE